MKKLLVVCGPTATGKTKLALKLAEDLDGEIISADSRQVYKFMDVGTGKEIPQGFEFRDSDIKVSNLNIGYYTDGKLKIWGYDLVNPDEEFSVSLYNKFVDEVLKDIYEREKLPILVGGTGLYIQAVTDGLSKIDVPRNEKIRGEYKNLSADDLFALISKKSKKRAKKINPSDRKNPRRLIRILEILDYEGKNVKSAENTHEMEKKDVLMVGLNIANRKNLFERIDQRVDERMRGIEDEIKSLKENGLLKFVPNETFGYREWNQYLSGKISKDEVSKLWKIGEHGYAKRQMTWFKRDPRIKWFDVSSSDWHENVEKLVKKWYKKGIENA